MYDLSQSIKFQTPINSHLLIEAAKRVHCDVRVRRVARRWPALREAAANVGSGAGRVPPVLPARASRTAVVRPVAHHSA